MVDLDKLYRLAWENATLVKGLKRRFLYAELEQKLQKAALKTPGKRPALLLSGIRGVGKTTLLLQLFGEFKEAFYFSADSLLVRTETLYAVVEQAYRAGHKVVFIDEIHKYPRWIGELKNISDDFTLQTLASGSSVASIKKGSIALGRRALDIPLPPLTLGEFFYLREGLRHEATMEEVLDKRLALQWLASHQNVEKYYRQYLSQGGFPGGIENQETIFRLMKKMIYEDAVAEFSLTKNKVDVADRLLAFLSVSSLGEFSYTSFSSMSGYAKSTVYETVQMLKELGILALIEEETPKAKAKGSMKLLFSHPNLRVAFADQLMKEAEIGALREEYFVFHLLQLGLPLFIPKKMKKNPDYEVMVENKKFLFEIGGRSKTQEQLQGQAGAVLGDEQLIVLGFVRKNEQ